MSDFPWLSIIAVVTGAIGTITGIAGLVLGYKGYRKAQDVKARDLRLELRKDVTDARAIVVELDEMTARIYFSEDDLKVLRSLHIKLDGFDNSDATTNNHAELESRLVSIHALTTKAKQLKTQLEKRIEADEKVVSDFREQLIVNQRGSR